MTEGLWSEIKQICKIYMIRIRLWMYRRGASSRQPSQSMSYICHRGDYWTRGRARTDTIVLLHSILLNSNKIVIHYRQGIKNNDAATFPTITSLSTLWCYLESISVQRVISTTCRLKAGQGRTGLAQLGGWGSPMCPSAQSKQSLHTLQEDFQRAEWRRTCGWRWHQAP